MERLICPGAKEATWGYKRWSQEIATLRPISKELTIKRIKNLELKS
jgi:hypothetical protein